MTTITETRENVKTSSTPDPIQTPTNVLDRRQALALDVSNRLSEALKYQSRTTLTPRGRKNADRRVASLYKAMGKLTRVAAPRFDAEAYLLDAIEAVRCGQPGVATDIVDGPRFADVKALLDALDVPASPYGPGQHARLFRFLCDAAWGRDLPARELPPLDPDTDDSRSAETCTTPHSGSFSASLAVGSPAGTRGGSLADDALAALCNAPNSRETDHEEGNRTQDQLVGGRVESRPIRLADPIPHGGRGGGDEAYADRSRGVSPGRSGPLEGDHRTDPHHAPIGLLIEGDIAYLDELGPDDTIDDFAQYPPPRSSGPKTTYPPAAAYGTENERDVRDAIQAFGAC